MTEYPSYELVRLCEAILADDEVSVDEVLMLGNWLNEHEGARKSWVGEILAAPVQKVLLDGKVNKTELRTIGRVVREVQKQWAKRQGDEAHQEALEKARCAVWTMDPSRATLPSIPVSIRVKSHSEKSVVYEVDLTGPSCTCPDWRAYRSSLPLGDLTRCCKHVFDAFGRLRPSDGWPGWVGAFLEQGGKPHPQRRWSVFDLGGLYVLAGVGGSDWADVFYPVDVHYQRFGYNFAERRWSYGIAPIAAAQIERGLLRELRRNAGHAGGLLRRLFGI